MVTQMYRLKSFNEELRRNSSLSWRDNWAASLACTTEKIKAFISLKDIYDGKWTKWTLRRANLKKPRGCNSSEDLKPDTHENLKFRQKSIILY